MRSVILLFLCSCWFTVSSQETKIQQKLRALQREDQLEEWIYVSLEEITAHPGTPQESLNELHRKLWRAPNRSEEHYAYLSLLSTQGYELLMRGHILNSIDRYEAAYQHYLHFQVKEYDIVEYVLKPLSNNYTRLGDYDRALYLQEKSLQFLLTHKENSSSIAGVYSNMAISYRVVGETTKALESVRKGLNLTALEAQASVQLYNILADIQYDDNEWEQAGQTIEKSLRILAQSKKAEPYLQMSAFTTAGNIALALNRYAQANAYYLKALEILQQHFPQRRLREKAAIYTKMGLLKAKQKQPESALNFFRQSLHILHLTDPVSQKQRQILYGDYHLVETFYEMGKSSHALEKRKEALIYFQTALLSADKMRLEYGNNRSKERLQDYLKEVAEKAIQVAYELHEKQPDPALLQTILHLSESSKGRTLWEQMKKNERSLELKDQDSLFSKRQTLQRALIYYEKSSLEHSDESLKQTIGDLRYRLSLVDKQIRNKYKQLIPPHPANNMNKENLPFHRVLSFFFGEQSVYLLEINQREVRRVWQLKDAPFIRKTVWEHVQHYYNQGPSAMINKPEAYYRDSHALFRLLFKDVPLSSERTTIIPDGVLGFLSFSSLITRDGAGGNPATWPFLIRLTPIDYAFSLATLQPSVPHREAKRFAAFFIDHTASGQNSLHAMTYESKAIRKWTSGDYFINKAANNRRFQESFHQYRILHIGTHAYLSGEFKEPTLDFGEEKMYLFELATSFQAPELVVLTACRTADGLLSKGEGVISMARGFKALGTSSSVAGLWNVNDESGAALIARFYEFLAQGKSGSEALHLAKLSWLEQEQPTTALCLPYYWDSLIYIGYDQPFELRSSTGNQSFYFLLLLPLLGLTGWLIWRRSTRQSRVLPLKNHRS